MKNLIIPKGYQSVIDPDTTEKAIKFIKDQFQLQLSSELKLRRVTAPMIVMKGTGLNDDLNGIERPVAFPIKGLNDSTAEVVHSLAKWKRYMLGELQIPIGKGLYTDMNALRPDEDFTNLHSIYVDQWDWEKSIRKEERKLDLLKRTVKQIYSSLKRTEYLLSEYYPSLQPQLPEEIHFIHAEDLLAQYPELSPKERETTVTKEFEAVFIIGIGGELANGEPHDGRAPDYDDWTTPTKNGYSGLNGDILLWNPVLEKAFEISSMGIRVDESALLKQLEIKGEEKRKELMFHKKLLAGELPYSIGGGIGQSRLCMYLLRKAHIGEVQSSIWPDELRDTCKKSGIIFL
ncbi:aspartate--ammonia ligase [Labilibaculum sp. DW002]|jgi:aspartate--ammonia ligase|uniref:Aspartate--ammonia ligase n=1 Tax=Paralabilibaculum antarcticum TaxID=2912572 RepID=A0ABT5VY77_9BACT|nr:MULTISPECIES: aspartate--ammonia ligase [unclassified Labilibaculum]MBI9058865.1 aspartate--ammonia ligase [Labilibaculum sp.]MDE5420301.1 aspartate--ammonia ligase [Labilibaculum sp. DW002]